VSRATKIAATFRTSTCISNIVQRYVLANQLPGARQKARNNTNPINRPRGIDRDVTKGQGATLDLEDSISPQTRDIQPKDVFSPTPDHNSVRNLVETGKDLSKAIKRQIPKDKGFDVVRNLSQYLIRTEGTGEDGTEEGK
jgi:hypothetical protein